MTKVRIPDIETAIRCIETLVNEYPYAPDGEELFREDVRHSFMILRGAARSRTHSAPKQTGGWRPIAEHKKDTSRAIVGRADSGHRWFAQYRSGKMGDGFYELESCDTVINGITHFMYTSDLHPPPSGSDGKEGGSDKHVFFTDGRAAWVCEVLSMDKAGITLKMYGKTTFFPWHKIDRIEK